MPFEHLVPLHKEDWGFFDRQRSVFSSLFKDMGGEWDEFERELEKMKREMFHLKPMDMDFKSDFGSDFKSDFGASSFKSDFGSDFKSDFGSNFKSDFGSSLLKVERPIVQDLKGNKRLSLRFDCKEFKPEEITVKTIDNHLMILAKHTEESPGRKVYREFSQQYILPDKIDPLSLNSTFTADGVLSIEGPAPDAIEAPRERILPIMQLK